MYIISSNNSLLLLYVIMIYNYKYSICHINPFVTEYCIIISNNIKILKNGACQTENVIRIQNKSFDFCLLIFVMYCIFFFFLNMVYSVDVSKYDLGRQHIDIIRIVLLKYFPRASFTSYPV